MQSTTKQGRIYQTYYPYIQEQQIQYQVEPEGQKQTTSSNYNEFSFIQQNYYQPPYPTYQFEYPQDHEIPNQIKNKKTKKNKNNDQKGLLPKTLESEKQQVEDPNQLISQQQGEQIVKPINPYPIFHYTQGSPMPKLQSDIVSNHLHDGQGAQDGSQQTQKQKGQHQQTKKPKKENINTGHWSTDEHLTYIQFLQQYEDIMTSSMMKKTSKIFKQMSELIGTRTPSQCRSHHQKFNPYALRGENGKRLPRAERSRAGRKKKNPQCDIPKAEEANFTINYEPHDPYLFMMYEHQKYYYPGIHPEYWNQQAEMDQMVHSIKKEEDMDQEHNQQIQIPQQPQDCEEYLKISFYHRNNTNPADYLYEGRNQTANDLLI